MLKGTPAYDDTTQRAKQFLVVGMFVLLVGYLYKIWPCKMFVVFTLKIEKNMTCSAKVEPLQLSNGVSPTCY